MKSPSLWEQILSRIEVIGITLRKRFEPSNPEDTVAFSISFIALAAKLSKADGYVCRDEVSAFRRVFKIPPEEEQNAAKVFNLCRQDHRGFESYAAKMHRALGNSERSDLIRRDVLDGLFFIAMADGNFNDLEEDFLKSVSRSFGISDTEFETFVSRHVPERENPFSILGIDAAASLEDARIAWKKLVKENHPDLLLSHGLPEEMIELANSRIRSINDAYDVVKTMRMQEISDFSPSI